MFEKLNSWLDRSEVSGVTFLTKILPILVPIIPAWQTKGHVVSILGYDPWMGWVAAIVVEFFGYGAMYKMIQFAFKRAGFFMVAFTVVIYLMYLAIILVFNVIPEIELGKPDYIIWMNALFSLLSVPAGALTAISALHTERTNAEREQEEREKAERERLRLERKAERERLANEQRERERLANEQRTPNTEHRTQPERRTPNAIPQPANERRTFSPFPNTEQGEKRTRIEQSAEQLQAKGIQPSVRNIQRALRIQDFITVNNRKPTPEEENALTGWSTSTISEVLKGKG